MQNVTSGHGRTFKVLREAALSRWRFFFRASSKLAGEKAYPSFFFESGSESDSLLWNRDVVCDCLRVVSCDVEKIKIVVLVELKHAVLLYGGPMQCILPGLFPKDTKWKIRTTFSIEYCGWIWFQIPSQVRTAPLMPFHWYLHYWNQVWNWSNFHRCIWSKYILSFY